MKLIVWNSQGAKWDACWTNYIVPAKTSLMPDDVMALLVEAGWAPWVEPGDVTVNEEYWMMGSTTWYSEKGAGKSTFCQGIESERRYKALWVPWMKNIIDYKKTNTRCSMGGALLPILLQLGQTNRIKVDEFVRPVIRVTLGKSATSGLTPKFTILLVHMVSGHPGYAKKLLKFLIAKVSTMVPEGTPAIIVGDMNINLLGTSFTLPENWRFLNTGVATQQKGGELDYGILYDPNDTLSGATVSVLEKYKTGNNKSDHSVLCFDIPIS